jgi:hypothetical protein
MDAPENPSADRFGPPPGQERFEAPKSRPRRAWTAGAVAMLYLILKEQLHFGHARGWTGGLLLLLLLIVGAADYVIGRAQRDARRADGGDPYTPPQNITRPS